MNFYQTLTGEQLEFGTVNAALQVFVHRIINRTQEILAQKNEDKSLISWNFAAEARKYLRLEYPELEEYTQVLRGPVGSIYRDCFYRLAAKEYAVSQSDNRSEEEREQEFIQNIRFNPARILIDCFLEDSATQAEFSRDARLDTATISRLFNYVLKPNSKKEPSLSLERFHDVCRQLNISPQAGYSPGIAPLDYLDAPYLYKSSNGITTRERQFGVVVAAVCRSLCFSRGDEGKEALNSLRAFLGLHLAALYGIDDVFVLDQWANTIFNDILAIPKLIEVESHLDDQTENDHLKLNSLLNFLEEFQLGVGNDKGTVTFATPEFRRFVQSALNKSREGSFHRETERPEASARFDYYRESIRDCWKLSLEVFRVWYESELFANWDSDHINTDLNRGSREEGPEPGQNSGGYSRWQAIQESLPPRYKVNNFDAEELFV